jgi:hypothetical protein
VIEGMFLCCGTRRRRKVRFCWKADMLSQKTGCLSRPEGAVGIIWVYIGILVRNDGALRAGKKLYIYLCGLCVARDSAFGCLRKRFLVPQGVEYGKP